MTHRVGQKGQVVIPKELRDRLRIVPGTEVTFGEADGAIHVIPVVDVHSLRGRYRASGLTRLLEAERAREPK